MADIVELTGIPGVDEVTQGLPAHALTIAIGAPGTGKTVLGTQIAVNAARQGRQVVFLSLFSEPHEKLLSHVGNFSFFDESLVGNKIELISLQPALAEGAEATQQAISSLLRERERPLIIIDGYRSMRNLLGAEASQRVMAAISARLPYHDASCFIASESDPTDPNQYPELASADVIFALENTNYGMRTYRTFQVLKLRGHAFLEGKHGFAIDENGVNVYPRMASSLSGKHPGISNRRMGFGIPELDNMLGGGLPEHSVTVVSGEPGTGKTTLGMHFLMAGLAAGEHGLVLTFRESPLDLQAKAAGLGIDMREALASGEIQVLRFPPVEIHPDYLGWRLREAVRADPLIRRVVLDGLTELEAAADIVGERRQYLPSIAEYLWQEGQTLVMLRDGQSLRSQEVPGTAGVPIAQNRIVLRRVEFNARLYRILSIISMQTSDHDSAIHEFRIGRGGIVVIPEGETERAVLRGIADGRSMDDA